MTDDQRDILRMALEQLEEKKGLVCGPEYMEEVAAALRALLDENAALKKADPNLLARRKVVQLIVLPQEGQSWNELYALCDDGTMWNRCEPQGWSQTLGIPQPEQPEQEAQR